MPRNEDPKSPGLKKRKRASGTAWYWFASDKAIEGGYGTKSVNLTEYADRPEMLIYRARCMQNEMNLWMRQGKMPDKKFDGTFKDLMERYQVHSKSSFQELKPHVQQTYLVYVRKHIEHIGHLKIDACNGLDVKDWFAQWRVGKNGKDQLAAANTRLSVLKAALAFGVTARFDEIVAFDTAVCKLRIPKPRRRKHAPTAEQIIAARLAAHKHKAPERALLYALQFETTARQWDFIGGWLPMSDPAVSAIISNQDKWVGPHWSAVQDMVLTIKPTKTEDTTEIEITYDLSACPMVLEELAYLTKREGPLIVNSQTGLPYTLLQISRGWRKDYEVAGIPKEIWNRDTRSGGITESRLSGASQDDRRRLAGHADADQTNEYERGIVDLQAHRNVMAHRVGYRAKNRQ